MNLFRRLGALMLYVLLTTESATADDVIQTLTAQRDALKSALADRLAADEKSAPGLDLALHLDKGIGRRGGMTVLLHRISGAWSAESILGLDAGVALRGMDATGLQLTGDRLTGDLIISWAATGAEDDADILSQTFTLEVPLVPVEERLVLVCRNMVGKDLELRYRRTDNGWAEEHGAEKPVLVHAFGDFEMDVADLVPDATGTCTGRIVFTKMGDPTDEKLVKFNAKKPVITFTAQLIDSRVSATYQLDAPGGKHYFGLRTEALTGAIQSRAAVGTYYAKGAKGEWMGTTAGPVLPLSLGLGAIDAIAPQADDDDTRRAAALYRQILVLGYARDRYPVPVPALINQTPVPLPTWAPDATGQATYLAGLARQAAMVVAGPSQVPGGTIGMTEDRFGPYYGDAALERDGVDANLLPAVTVTGPQDWRHPTAWSFCGPFAVYDQRAPILYPEILHAAGVAFERERVFTDNQAGESIVKADTIGWITAGQEGALVYAPKVPAAASASHFFFCWYAATEVASAVDQEVWVSLGIEGQVRVWLNDVPVWQSGTDDEGVTPNRFKLAFVKGRNRLLVRVGSSLDSNRTFSRVDWFEGYGKQAQGRVTFSGFRLSACVQGQPGGEAATSTPVPPAADGPQGYRGNGSGIEPAADPPLAWDLDKKINVAWRVDLPRGTAEPVARNGRIFVTAEPHLLFCFDGATGQQLWQASARTLSLLDPTAFPEGDALADYCAARSGWGRRQAEAKGDNAKATAVKQAIDQEQAQWKSVIDAMKMHHISDRGGWATATPVVTADRVFVHFGTGVAACYDLDGKETWRVATGQPWSEPNMGSPVLVDGLLVVQAHLKDTTGDGAFGLLALDSATGVTRWTCAGPARRTRNAQARAQGLGNGVALMRLQNGDHVKNLLITGDGAIVDAADGTLLRRSVFGFEANRTPPVVRDDTVFICPVGGLEAVTCWLDATGRLGTRTRYRTTCPLGRGQAKTTTTWGPAHWMKGPVVTDDTIYAVKVDSAHVPQHYPLPWTQLDRWDRATGRYLGRSRTVIRDATDPTVPPVLAGDWLLVADGGDPVPGFNGTVGTGCIACLRLGPGAPAVVTRSRTGMMRASPVAVGDRLFLRDDRSLACIRVADDAGRTFVEEVKAQVLIDEFPAPPEPEPVVDIPGSLIAVPDDTPVSRLQPKHLPDAWLLCGPVPAAADAPALAVLGGAAQLRPTNGTPFAGLAFAPLDAKHINRDKFGVATHFDLFQAAPHGQQCSYYLYTLLEVPEVGTYKFLNEGSGYHAWLGGIEVPDKTIIHLGIGRYPLLVQVTLGKLPPFIKAMPVTLGFTRIKQDPVADYRAWIDSVRANRDRFQAVIDALPKSMVAGKALLILKRLEEWDQRQGAKP